MRSFTKRRLRVSVLLLVIATTYVVYGPTHSGRSTAAKTRPTTIEKPTGRDARPLDGDFKAAMQRASKEATHN
jgi:hypothetical protein